MILLSLAGYSGGAVARAGQWADLKPQIIDLVLVLLIWTAGIYSRTAWHFGKWVAILVWVASAIIIGYLATSFRKIPELKKPASPGGKDPPTGPLKKLWQNWTDFSRHMGSYQSRVLLSFFFFLLVSPIALLLKAFSDPLRIKPKSFGPGGSHWLSKKEIDSNQEQYRRQF